MSRSQEELVQIGHRYLYTNYRQPPVVMQRGAGVEVWDVAGKRYLDFLAGVAVNALGHASPDIARTLAEQSTRLLHVSNYFFNEPNILLAEKLCAVTGMDRALFCNSGTEAIEAVLKLTRRHFYNLGQTERHTILAFERSFHGRTMGALAATGQAGYREGFGPLGPVVHVPFGDLEAVARALSAQRGSASSVAGVLFEPVQGEGGVLPASTQFVKGLRALCDESGALLLADEIQTGVGRTGRFLGVHHFDVRPDVIAMAKGLGGGFPIGAMLCTEALAGALPPGSHGTTFGGNALASSVGLTVLDVIERDGILGNVERMGAYLDEQLQALVRKHPAKVVSTRGLGLLRALELSSALDARVVLGAIRDAGVLLSIAGGSSLRFSPPLIVSQSQIDEAVALVDGVLGSL
jgi:acetylornithine/N-succinyldiaminopimelate aminotransferase